MFCLVAGAPDHTWQSMPGPHWVAQSAWVWQRLGILDSWDSSGDFRICESELRWKRVLVPGKGEKLQKQFSSLSHFWNVAPGSPASLSIRTPDLSWGFPFLHRQWFQQTDLTVLTSSLPRILAPMPHTHKVIPEARGSQPRYWSLAC